MSFLSVIQKIVIEAERLIATWAAEIKGDSNTNGQFSSTDGSCPLEAWPEVQGWLLLPEQGRCIAKFVNCHLISMYSPRVAGAGTAASSMLNIKNEVHVLGTFCSNRCIIPTYQYFSLLHGLRRPYREAFRSLGVKNALNFRTNP